MKLLADFYTITETSEAAFTIKLNAEHFIYKAHFPGEPITPGVVIMQISFELLELLTKKKLQLSTVKNVKFLQLITPDATPVITYNFSKLSENDNELTAQVTVTSGENIFAKLSLICKIL